MACFFFEFIGKYGRTYQSEAEIAEQFAIFKDNLKRIEERNARGGALHGINKFPDLSPPDFNDRYLGRTEFDKTKIILT